MEPQGQNDFSLTVAMSEEGSVDYVVYYGDWDVDFHGTPLEHALQAPTCSADLISADPNALRGSVAASGAFDVPVVGSDFTFDVSPRCPEPVLGALGAGAPEPCSLAFQGLTPNSPYQVCLVAQDLEGNRCEQLLPLDWLDENLCLFQHVGASHAALVLVMSSPQAAESHLCSPADRPGRHPATNQCDVGECDPQLV